VGQKFRHEGVCVKRWKDIDATVVRLKEGEGGGAWVVKSKLDGQLVRIIASTDDGWDHVSVSLENRMPTWEEMDMIKRLFFKPNEIAVEYHVPPSDHINIHPNCLHLWRPQRVKIPLPPKWMV
jgi:hypothetical protein